MDHHLRSSRRFRVDEEEQLNNLNQNKPTPASMSSFPNELLEEILSRMPVRSLTRFKCVCKSWRDLISSEVFITLHLKKYNTSIILVHSISENSRLVFNVLYPPNTAFPEYVDNKGTSDVKFPVITASCNGIICLWDFFKIDHIALWNPATKDLKIIPKSNLPGRSMFDRCRVAFGFDDVRNDYKIVQALFGSDGRVQFELYSLNTGLWKKLDMDIRAVSESPREFFIHSTGERIVCWLAMFRTNVDARRWELVLFDMSTERFEIVQVPVNVSNHDSLNLIPYEGSIGVRRTFPDTITQELWALNDIYSDSGRGLRSWRKVNLPICPPSMLSRTMTVAYWEDCLLYHDVFDNSLILFDHGCQRFLNPVGVSSHKYFPTAIRYTESLVRVM